MAFSGDSATVDHRSTRSSVQAPERPSCFLSDSASPPSSPARNRLPFPLHPKNPPSSPRCRHLRRRRKPRQATATASSGARATGNSPTTGLSGAPDIGNCPVPVNAMSHHAGSIMPTAGTFSPVHGATILQENRRKNKAMPPMATSATTSSALSVKRGN